VAISHATADALLYDEDPANVVKGQVYLSWPFVKALVESIVCAPTLLGRHIVLSGQLRIIWLVLADLIARRNCGE
jgi:hypothetical protein